MNRILTCGLAATLVTMLAPSVFADNKGGGHAGGGGSRGGGGGAHFSAPAHVSAPHFSAPRMSVAHAPTMQRSVPSAPRIATQAPQFRSAPTVRSRPNTTFTPSVAQQRNFRAQRNAPTVAFGGTANNNAALNAQNARNNFAAGNQSQTFSTRDARNFRVPDSASRGWEHNRIHEWNHHHYRWYGGNWVIFDSGYPYDYGYDGGYYGEPAPYSDYTYDSTAPGSLVSSAQDRLNRLGYSAGAVDGVFGAQTRDAIADFQNDNHLPATGNLDTATVQALGL